MKNMYEENVNVDSDFDENFYENAENEFDEMNETEPMDEYVPEEPFFENSSDDVLTYKCPNCGAGLVFDAEKQSFICKFCISEFSEADLEKTEADKKAKEEADQREFDESVNQYVCTSCGAEIIVDKSTAADFCYHCHNPVVLLDKLSGNLRPSKIVPFKIDKDEAKQRFLAYARQKVFCPNDYFSKAQSEKIAGVYYPFWVTDADTNARLDTTAYKVRSWTSGDYRYTETSRYDVKRGGKIHFEDITSSAISEEDKKMLEGILPYPSDEHKDFAIPYLQGFVAKKRDIDRDMLTSEVKGKMNAYAEHMLRDTIVGYTRVSTDSMSVNIHSSHWEYTLMPIWILTYKKDKKTYVYAMNGSTGKIYGELPVSPWKLALLGLGVTLIAGLITYLIGGMLL